MNTRTTDREPVSAISTSAVQLEADAMQRVAVERVGVNDDQFGIWRKHGNTRLLVKSAAPPRFYEGANGPYGTES